MGAVPRESRRLDRRAVGIPAWGDARRDSEARGESEKPQHVGLLELISRLHIKLAHGIKYGAKRLGVRRVRRGVGGHLPNRPLEQPPHRCPQRGRQPLVTQRRRGSGGHRRRACRRLRRSIACRRVRDRGGGSNSWARGRSLRDGR
eukprot:scaffold186388_cov29-Tisochrysis_lutea.AAC.2